MTEINKKRIGLVTGANRGLGFEVVRQLARTGMKVFLAARDKEKGIASQNILRSEGLEVEFLSLETTASASISSARAVLEREVDRIDVLVNNAGGNYDYGVSPSQTDLTFLRQTLELNLVATWAVTVAFLPLLKKSRSARIVNVASGAGSFGDANFGLAASEGVSSYSVSKLALNGFTVKLARELKETKIIVNSVCPGFTATYPGAREQGARPVEEGAASIVWAAMIPDNGPRGGFFRDGKAIGW